MIDLDTLGLPEAIAAIIAIALNAYVLTGGADFGGGLWDLIASGPRRTLQRELIAHSIGPIWEANHVWLIVVVVLLFSAFPAAFSTLGIVLHIPITIMLIGIVLRGSAFVFRSYGSRDGAAQMRWGLAFAIGSIVTPVVLGSIVGAIANGAVSEAADHVGTGTFMAVFVSPWLAAFPIVVGLFALGLFAFLAATYLTVEARDDAVRDDFRRRALIMAAIVFALAAAALVIAGSAAPGLAARVIRVPLLQAATVASALTTVVTLWMRRYRAARVAAAAQVSLILWGWLLAQYPYVIPPALSIRDTAAPAVTLKLLVVGVGIGAAVLLPSLRYLFGAFRRVS
jgi:cytochrome bd ubiquinol oxidase subunit II